MVDSKIVLFGQTLGYTIYAVVIILLVGWFGWRLTHAGKVKGVKPGLFYAFVAVPGGAGRLAALHRRRCTIPWVKPMDMRPGRHHGPTRSSTSSVAGHRFQLPAETLQVVVQATRRCCFNVTSSDLTYGFGLFRPDHSMLFQMQVVPGHVNDILWQFDKPGVYTIRSTEYSGPAGVDMVVKDAVVVSCDKR
ncbi:MAG: hypothetical protein MZU91_11300 [Desulfosudis oleivorans]|nr:hypothetical protein [Desulfosudis oleivorans]